MPAKNSKSRRITVLSCLSILILAGFLVFITWAFGRVSGEEFSPTHFTSRSFVFYEIPLLQLQVVPIKRTAGTINITNLLRSQNYIQVPTGEGDTWHLVQLKRGPSKPTLADAEILVSHLRLGESTGTSVWETWSRDHPKAAAVLWPEIKKLAERELYVLVPELFSVAEQETDPTALKAKIAENLRNQYLLLAEDLIATKQPDIALSVVMDGLSDFPDDKPLLDLKSKLNTL